MRLLHFNAAGDLSWTLFKKDEIPPYAILSHTWGSDEVIFEDLLGPSVKEKAGYRKIAFCGEQAARDGLRYFWVDTCCIDKRNNTELSKAINSMFRWYRDAVKCYVYLSDVSAAKDTDADDHFRAQWKSELRRSRWFTRGWTLQELLAPASVEFFSSEGLRLANKQSLKQQINEITGIPIPALQNHPLDEFTTTQRMTWAAKRQTQEEEDEAYCLLGIFGLSMPLVYGEGRVKALRRLEIEIEALNLEHRAFPRSLPSQITYPSTETHGESDSEKKLKRELAVTDPVADKNSLKRQRGSPVPGTCNWLLDIERFRYWLGSKQAGILWLYGNPGIGKTTMSIYLAEMMPSLFKQEFAATLLYFFCSSSYESRKSATSVVKSLLFQLVSRHQPSMELVVRKFETYKSFLEFDILWTTFMEVALLEKTKTKYIIIDALDECDPGSQKILLKQIRESFPPKHPFTHDSDVRILITSRHYPEIQYLLAQYPSINMGDNTRSRHDIGLFIEDKLINMSSQYPSKVKEKVAAILWEKSEGTFLWIGIACEELEGIPAKDAVKFLHSLPKGLHSLYERLMTAAVPDNSADSTVRRILNTVAVAEWPLTVPEISLACQLYLEEDEEERSDFTMDEIKKCRQLVYVQDETVHLLHKSVKDFLFKTLGIPFASEDAHAAIAAACIECIVSSFRSYGGTTIRHDINTEQFWVYASNGWPRHAYLAKERFRIEGAAVEFFSTNSPSRDFWLQKGIRVARECFRPSFSILQMAAHWGLITLIDYLIQDLSLTELLNRDCLIAAIEADQVEVLSYLLSGYMRSTRLTERVAIAVVSSPRAMQTLLDHQRDHGFITDKVVAGAARRNGDVLSLLLTRFGGQLRISRHTVNKVAFWCKKESFHLLIQYYGLCIVTSRAIEFAVRNSHGMDLLKSLFAIPGFRFSDVHLMKVLIFEHAVGVHEMRAALNQYSGPITEELIITAMRSCLLDHEKLKLLVERSERPISTRLLRAVFDKDTKWFTGFSSNTLEFIIDQFEDRFNLPKAVLVNFVRQTGLLEKLLGRYGDGAFPTQTLFKLSIIHSTETFKLLFESQKGAFTLTEEIVVAAVTHPHESGFDHKRGIGVLEFLITHFGSQVPITENVIHAAAKNPSHGLEMVELLLKHVPESFFVSGSILEAAAGNRSFGFDIVLKLLDHVPGQFLVSKRILETAAGNSWHGLKILKLFLERYSEQFVVSESLFEAALDTDRCAAQITELLLTQCQSRSFITERIVLATIANRQKREIMPMLAAYCGEELPLTDKILQAAAGARQGETVMKLLLDCYGARAHIDEEVLITATSNPSYMAKVLDILISSRGRQLDITEEVMISAAKQRSLGEAMVRKLLDSHGDLATVTSRVAEAAAGNGSCGGRILQLLKKRCGHKFEVTRDVLRAAAATGSAETLQMLMEWRMDDAVPFEELIEVAAETVRMTGTGSWMLKLDSAAKLRLLRELKKARGTD